MKQHVTRSLSLEFVSVTEQAAIAASAEIGRGNGKMADQKAVDAMRESFNSIHFHGTVVIGEGEKDKAPQLYRGEVLGIEKSPVFDIAVDPLEATDSVAFGRSNALSIFVAGTPGSLFSAPDMYMEKIAAGPNAANIIDMHLSVEENIVQVAQVLQKPVKDITVIVLDRPRHEDLIHQIRKAGARIKTITDGDVAGAIGPSLANSGIDLLMGIGKSTEAVLASAAIKYFGGKLLARFVKETKSTPSGFKPGDDIVYSSDDFVKGEEYLFIATGVLDGPLLPGVLVTGEHGVTYTMLIDGISHTLRYITSYHKTIL